MADYNVPGKGSGGLTSGNDRIETPADGSYADGVFNWTPNTRIANAFDDVSEYLDNTVAGQVDAVPNTTILRDASALAKVAGPPTDSQHIVNKAYVDGYVAAGLTLKEPVRILTKSLSLTSQGAGVYSTGTWTGEQGVTLVAADRFLRASPAGDVLDGIYVVNGSNGSGGLLVQRAADADNAPSVGEVRSGIFCLVTEGDYHDQGWALAAPIGNATLGTDVLIFVPFSGAGSFDTAAGLGRLGNTVFISTNLNAATGGDIGVGNLLVGTGGDSLTELVAPTSDGQTWHLSITNGAVTWTKVNVANITGTLPIARGGTGIAAFTAGIVKSPGGTSALTTAVAGTDYITPTAGVMQTIHSASSDVLTVRGGTTAGSNVILRVQDESQQTGYSFKADGTVVATTNNINTLLLDPGTGSLHLGYDTGTSMVPIVLATTSIQAFLDGSGGYRFSVDSSGNLSANSKSFNIPHPTKEDMRLVYGCLEGPEYGVYHRGTAQGENRVYVTLPDYWSALVKDDYTVQLTGWGRQVVLVEKEEQGFWVKNANFIDHFASCHFDYVVFGSRKDVSLVVEQPVRKS